MLKCMDYCNLLDLEALGQSLLGATKGWGLQYTRVRFDRTLANSNVVFFFNLFLFTNLPRSHSDHHSICVKESNQANNMNRDLHFMI